VTPALVLFDCDGVLVDSEPITNAILAEDLAQRGLPLPPNQIVRLFVGGTLRGVGVEAARLGADIPPDWVETIYARMYARLRQGTPLVRGIVQVLDRLDAAGIPYAVGSNGSMEKMRITLGQHPTLWDRLGENLFSAHEHGTAKPDPDLYLIAAKAMGIAPAQVVVIDDSPPGCRAAQRANIRCFGYAEHDDGARLATEGATVFHDMEKLPNLLGLI